MLAFCRDIQSYGKKSRKNPDPRGFATWDFSEFSRDFFVIFKSRFRSPGFWDSQDFSNRSFRDFFELSNRDPWDFAIFGIFQSSPKLKIPIPIGFPQIPILKPTLLQYRARIKKYGSGPIFRFTAMTYSGAIEPL